MKAIEFRIAKLLRSIYEEKGLLLTIGTVESATGGKIADKITNVPGISDFFKGSIIAYSNEVKSNIVGVNRETLSTKGAVSRETAIEMAEGGRKLLRVHVCLSDTGIAGPTGDSTQKPIGLFYVSLSTYDGVIEVEKLNFSGSRLKNKNSAVQSALGLLEKYLQNIFAKY
jgi:nicotinamide-nucleotide amidase